MCGGELNLTGLTRRKAREVQKIKVKKFLVCVFAAGLRPAVSGELK